MKVFTLNLRYSAKLRLFRGVLSVPWRKEFNVPKTSRKILEQKLRGNFCGGTLMFCISRVGFRENYYKPCFSLETVSSRNAGKLCSKETRFGEYVDGGVGKSEASFIMIHQA